MNETQISNIIKNMHMEDGYTGKKQRKFDI